MSDLIDNLEANSPYSEKHRFSAPIMERIGFLYSNGMTNEEIYLAISQEFSDVVSFPITYEMVRTVVSKNQEFFKKRRKDMGELYKKEIDAHAIQLFGSTKEKEEKMVIVFGDKLDEALDQLSQLDLGEQDDKGNFKNTSRAFTLVEFADKIQTKMAKIVGSDAYRELAVLRKKLELQSEFKEGVGTMGLPPMREAGSNLPKVN